jgi:hypothetical protein
MGSVTRLVIAAFAVTFLAHQGFADDAGKAKAKAKARAVLALASAVEPEKPVVAKPPATLDAAKSLAASRGKPLVVWVGDEPPADAKAIGDAIQFTVPKFDELPHARCVVFACENGQCSRKSSVTSAPSVELLRTLVREAASKANRSSPGPPKPTAATSEPSPFFIDCPPGQF